MVAVGAMARQLELRIPRRARARSKLDDEQALSLALGQVKAVRRGK